MQSHHEDTATPVPRLGRPAWTRVMVLRARVMVLRARVMVLRAELATLRRGSWTAEEVT